MSANTPEEKDYLQDLYRVGPDKPMGYLPISTIAMCGATLDELMEWALTHDLQARLFTEQQCRVGSGALYVWSDSHVQLMLDEHKEMIKSFKWPIHTEAFVRAVATKLAPEGLMYELVGVMFADERMKDSLLIKRAGPSDIKPRKKPQPKI